MKDIQNKDNVKILSSNLFPVVGVGASAGGLEAFKRLIRAIPEDSGFAYILVQHLEPTHESILTELLQNVTLLPVHEITNNVRVEPDHIYIIPSNKLLTATDGILQLSPRAQKKEQNMPIDVFFTSLAEVHQAHSIGVILSGTGSDGTRGLKAIKDRGGITFVQEQQSAAFDGMPQSAIDADVADFVLTPEEICQELANMKNVFKTGLPADTADLSLEKEDAFKKLLGLIRVKTGADFTHYKQTTIRRRIARRIVLNKCETIYDYLTFVNENLPEQELLYQDLLIPVTDFFRDPKTYDIICKKILPALTRDKNDINPLRIWNAGCATGEEPYSIAMCLFEYLGDRVMDAKIQIFATDLSDKTIAKARSGIYNKREVASLSEERLLKFFTKTRGSYQINKEIRDICVFACHNFVKDPPYSRMDFISCRNVLIYMEPALQKKALTNFHYALKDKGYLLLGKSETTGPAADLFTVSGRNDKLYIKKGVGSRFIYPFERPDNSAMKIKGYTVSKDTGREDFQKSADDLLLFRYAPPGVIVNDQFEIVQFRGSTGNWLEASSGKPSLNVLKMARQGLAFELRNALNKVKKTNKPIVREGIMLELMGSQTTVTIEVTPLLNTTEVYFLIVFKEAPSFSDLSGDKEIKAPPANKSSQVTRLKNEIAQLREDMRRATEDQEAFNEELQIVNEELLSGSEELQSLNEELETSKEEIQSTNEELTTLNQELFDRNEQLNLSRIYAESIIATIREPLIVLDKNMQVKTANRAYYTKFNAREEDTEGKSFYKLENGQWDLTVLREMLEESLSSAKKIAGFEITHTFNYLGERTLLLNASQIFNTDNTEQLILLAIEDVTELKKVAADLKTFTRELEKQVAERTAALKESNTALNHSNENLEQFATIASHDLQEPLRKIRTFANLLNQRYSSELTGDGKDMLNKIYLSAERMASLIKDVLNFSKIQDASRIFEKTDLNDILMQVMIDFELLIREKNATVTHDHLPVINAIPLQINQLFYNLLSNALKFSAAASPPEISITSSMLLPEEVKAHPSLDPAVAYCEIVFRDNGIGFDPQFAEQMFLIFERLNARERFEGTGIGLALCKRIVINHRGEIYAETGDAKGARFHIILPAQL